MAWSVGQFATFHVSQYWSLVGKWMISWSNEIETQDAKQSPLAHSNSPVPGHFHCEPEDRWGSCGGAEYRFRRTLPFVKSLYKTQHTVSQIAKHCSITTINFFLFLFFFFTIYHETASQAIMFFLYLGHESILSSVDSSKPALFLLLLAASWPVWPSSFS